MKKACMDKGIIGFFDILGFQSFLENNRGETSRNVVDVLNNLEPEITKILTQIYSHYSSPEKVTKMVGYLKWLVFSDTILLYIELDETDDFRSRSNKWSVMNFASNVLWRHMFEIGLPLRGMIHTGDFFVEKKLFCRQSDRGSLQFISTV
jgi:hypothetical protein